MTESIKSKREIWVDNVKVIACILVALGHFFQSMTKSGILPADDLYNWFNDTIYCFHVPLFFVCSGYLYQKLSVVHDFGTWGKNVAKKALALGVPYFVFSFLIWAVKNVFSGSVNEETGGLVDTLFIHPIAPCWYLYTLFFIFVITLTFKNKVAALCGLMIALVFKMISLTGWECDIYIVSKILDNEIWFVIGMCIYTFGFQKIFKNKKWLTAGFGCLAVFIALSVLVYILELNFYGVSFLIGLLGCASVVLIISIIYAGDKQSRFFGFLAEYTMPIFLMHTLFAAALRIVLLKVGIDNAIIHIVFGIAISFIGPIIAGLIMKKIKYLEFFMYPGKFIKIR